MAIGTIHSEPMLTVCEELSDLIPKLDSNPNPDRVGFYLTWARSFDGGLPSFAQAQIGEIVNPYGAASLRGYSAEKALRLAAHRMIDSKAVSSWQTANPRLNRHQGAVAFPSSQNGFEIISVSAYESSIDEAAVLLIGLHMGWANTEFNERVVVLTGNEQYEHLRKAFHHIRS